MTKTIKIIIITLCLVLTLSGCQQQTDIEQYNTVSEQHNTQLTEASEDFKAAIDQYNAREYDTAIKFSNSAKEKFSKAKDLSEQGKNIAQNIKDRKWLAEFKEIYVQMEELRIKQCGYLIESSQAAKNKDNSAAQEAINKMSELNNDYNKMQQTLLDIKDQHPESFQ